MMKYYTLLLNIEFYCLFVSKVHIVHELKMLGVRVKDLMDDDVSGDSCGTGEYPLLTTINYALRNNKTRPILMETIYSGFYP
jgi:hypothetical protein